MPKEEYRPAQFKDKLDSERRKISVNVDKSCQCIGQLNLFPSGMMQIAKDTVNKPFQSCLSHVTAASDCACAKSSLSHPLIKVPIP